jgi:very-short-patch-repair endonuclease
VKTLLTERAKRLRREDTLAEARLWQALRAHRLGGWKWKRQVARGPYIVDFLCLEAGLVVEVDGATHSSDEEVAYDAARTRFLESLGLRVMRVTNGGVFESLDSLCDAILGACGGERPGWSGEG